MKARGRGLSNISLNCGSNHLVVQTPGPRHGRQWQPFTADVAEDLKNHEAEQEEVETGADSCNDDECHLRQQQSRNIQKLKQKVESF